VRKGAAERAVALRCSGHGFNAGLTQVGHGMAWLRRV